MSSRFGPAALALLGAFVVQLMFAPHIAVFGVVPNFPLLVVITLAFLQGASAGATAGFVAGLLLDLIGTGPVGAWAFVLTLVGYGAGLLRSSLFAEGWHAPAVIAFVAALIGDTLYLVLLTVLGVGPSFGQALLTVVIPRALYNAVLLVLAYPWLARLLRSDRSVRSFRRVA